MKIEFDRLEFAEWLETLIIDEGSTQLRLEGNGIVENWTSDINGKKSFHKKYILYGELQ